MHNFILFAILAPKIIKVGKKLRSSDKNNFAVFLRHGVLLLLLLLLLLHTADVFDAGVVVAADVPLAEQMLVNTAPAVTFHSSFRTRSLAFQSTTTSLLFSILRISEK